MVTYWYIPGRSIMKPRFSDPQICIILFYTPYIHPSFSMPWPCHCPCSFLNYNFINLELSIFLCQRPAILSFLKSTYHTVIFLLKSYFVHALFQESTILPLFWRRCWIVTCAIRHAIQWEYIQCSVWWEHLMSNSISQAHWKEIRCYYKESLMAVTELGNS